LQLNFLYKMTIELILGIYARACCSWATTGGHSEKSARYYIR